MADANSSQSAELRTLLVTAITIGVVLWDIAFWLGVYGTIFYSKLQTLWVAATVVLLVEIMTPRRDQLVRGWGLVALLAPTIWFAANALISEVYVSWFDDLVWFAALLSFAFAIPYILYILFELMEWEAVQLSTRYRNCLIFILLIVSLAGYGVGTNHFYFVSCEQFKLAGDNVPESCGEWVTVE